MLMKICGIKHHTNHTSNEKKRTKVDNNVTQPRKYEARRTNLHRRLTCLHRCKLIVGYQ